MKKKIESICAAIAAIIIASILLATLFFIEYTFPLFIALGIWGYVDERKKKEEVKRWTHMQKLKNSVSKQVEELMTRAERGDLSLDELKNDPNYYTIFACDLISLLAIQRKICSHVEFPKTTQIMPPIFERQEKIIIAKPVVKNLRLLSANKVSNGNSEFMAMVFREGNILIHVSYPIDRYEKSGVSEFLASKFRFIVTVKIIEIPNDGKIYGYKNKYGEIVAFNGNSRYRLLDIMNVNLIEDLNATYHRLYGKRFSPMTDSKIDRFFYEGLERSYNKLKSKQNQASYDAFNNVESRKSDVEWLKHKGVRYLYHFTDKSNVELIKSRGGLYSWAYLESENLPIPRAGGNDFSRMLDQQYRLENYVRTSFCKKHPMAYVCQTENRINDFIVLKIDVNAIAHSTIMYTNKNATKTGHQQSMSITILEKINFSIFGQEYYTLSDVQKEHYQAEVLFEQHIPLKFITFE